MPTGSEARRCSQCERSDGTLAAYESVRDRVAAALVRTLGVDLQAAQQAAEASVAALPDWVDAEKVSENAVPSRFIIEVMHGDVEVRGVAGLSAPRIEKGGRRCILVPTSEGWCLQTAIELRKGLAALMPDLERKIEVQVPEHYPHIELKMQAGKVAVIGVAARITGTLEVGELDLRDVSGLDVAVHTGQLQVQAALTNGEHRIVNKIGSVKLDLKPGTSLDLIACIQNGTLDFPGLEGGFGRRALMSRPIHSVIGEGEAHLVVEVDTGSLEIRTAAPALLAR